MRSICLVIPASDQSLLHSFPLPDLWDSPGIKDCDLLFLLRFSVNEERDSGTEKSTSRFSGCVCVSYIARARRNISAIRKPGQQEIRQSCMTVVPARPSFCCPAESTYLLNMIGHLQAIKGKISAVTLEL